MRANDILWARRVCFRLAATVALAAFVCGCETAHEYSLTYKLWDKGAGKSCRPAPDPKLAVFASETQSEILVLYDALSEREDNITRRAYFVYTNEARIAAKQPPTFVDATLATNLSAVPIVTASNGIANVGFSAVFPVSTDLGPGFELYRDGRSQGAHSLPVHSEGGLGTTARVALTPLAVTGDTLMVGVVTGVVATYMWIAVGAPPFTGTR